MSNLYVPLAIKNAGISLELLLPKLKGDVFTEAQYGKVSRLYRCIGIGELLCSNDQSLLFERLFRSANAYIHFLENAPSSEIATSKALAFYDAVACGFSDGAKKIAQLCPRSQNQAKEYEEEFLCSRVLMDFFFLGKTKEEVDDMMSEYESYHNDNADLCFPLLKSLLDEDNEAFCNALGDFVDAEKNMLNGDGIRGEPEEVTLLSKISIPLLAWLRFAEYQKFSLDDEYALAPGSARFKKSSTFGSEDSWKQIESFRSLL